MAAKKMDTSRFNQWIRANLGQVIDQVDIVELLGLIISDRDAVRSEVMKDHFKIGEIIDVDQGENGWTQAMVQARLGNSLVFGKIRRSPKTRPMTRMEKIKALKNSAEWRVEQLGDSFLDELMRISNIPNEIEEL